MSNLLELGLTMAETRVNLSSVKLPVYVRSQFGVTKQLTGFPGMMLLFNTLAFLRVRDGLA